MAPPITGVPGARVVQPQFGLQLRHVLPTPAHRRGNPDAHGALQFRWVGRSAANGCLVFDSTGALYGTTNAGGMGGGPGAGTIFKLTPPSAEVTPLASGTGPWTETTIHTFTGAPDAGGPLAALTPGPDGALYGTTYYSGTGTACTFPNRSGCGTVFELKPPTTFGGPTAMAPIRPPAW
jgi:hypothetical protein